jgi:biopolymer transport protein ExbD
MAKRALPEINAGSMADIAFLLLIFFLVTTTMDVDSGINRKLPPWEPEQLEDPPPIKKKNIFTVLVNSNDQILVEDNLMDIEELREATKRFLNNNGNGKCDYCVGGLQSPTSSDSPGKAIVSLQNDRGTSYDIYIAVQNELAAAYNELREELAQRQYGKSYEDLGEEQRDHVQDAYPQKISEAEPVSLGG